VPVRKRHQKAARAAVSARIPASQSHPWRLPADTTSAAASNALITVAPSTVGICLASARSLPDLTDSWSSWICPSASANAAFLPPLCAVQACSIPARETVEQVASRLRTSGSGVSALPHHVRARRANTNVSNCRLYLR